MFEINDIDDVCVYSTGGKIVFAALSKCGIACRVICQKDEPDTVEVKLVGFDKNFKTAAIYGADFLNDFKNNVGHFLNALEENLKPKIDEGNKFIGTLEIDFTYLKEKLNIVSFDGFNYFCVSDNGVAFFVGKKDAKNVTIFKRDMPVDGKD